MKILHTADVHLKRDDAETVEGLRSVLSEAETAGVDLVTIGGDLFDSPEDAEALRPDLRDLFSDNSFGIVAIPGNHDEHVYRSNLRFGDDLEVLVDSPITSRTFGDVEIIGVPFTATMTEDLYSQLQAAGSADRTQVLLLHCTLDIGFHSSDVGESEGTYFPVTKATLAAFDFEYVLAGHIHSTDREVPLDNGGKFIYPGSPVSHSTTETGRRTAALIDTDRGNVSSVALDSFYYDEFSTTVRPGEEESLFDAVSDWVSTREGDDCDLSIHVDGFVDQAEDEFFERLTEAATPVEPNDGTRTVRHVLEHPLYRRFLSKLDEREDVEHEEHVKTQVIDVLARLLAQRKVQPT